MQLKSSERLLRGLLCCCHTKEDRLLQPCPINVWLFPLKLLVCRSKTAMISTLCLLELKWELADLSPAACIGHLTSASYVRDRNLSTNSDVVAAGQLFTCKMTPVLDLYRNITRLKTTESSSLLQKGTLCVRFANLHRLTPIDCYVLTICLRQTDLPVCLRVNAVSPSRTAPCLHV